MVCPKQDAGGVPQEDYRDRGVSRTTKGSEVPAIRHGRDWMRENGKLAVVVWSLLAGKRDEVAVLLIRSLLLPTATSYSVLTSSLSEGFGLDSLKLYTGGLISYAVAPGRHDVSKLIRYHTADISSRISTSLTRKFSNGPRRYRLDTALLGVKARCIEQVFIVAVLCTEFFL